MRPESERARRYAQCHFVDMGTLKRFMLGQIRCVFYNFAKTKSSGVNIKQCQKRWKYVSELNP